MVPDNVSPRRQPENAAPYAVQHPGGLSLFPRWHKHPYFIYATDYLRASAGIKAMHILCHTLNQMGARAFVVARKVSPELNTPLLTRRIIDDYASQGITPIVVYSETTFGNPMGASCVVRYLLNYAGHLGGDKTLNDDELIISYARGMRQDGGQEFVLHIPVANSEVFHPPPPEEEAARSGSCFYAAKYKAVHGGTLLPVTEGMTEITRFRPDSQTPREIARLFRQSEFFYCYENSTLSLEAVLSNCPVVLLPNPWFTTVIASDEYRNVGFAWGDTPEEKARARATLPEARARYDFLIQNYWEQLRKFIDLSQARAAQQAQVGYLELVAPSFPLKPGSVLLAFMYIMTYLVIDAPSGETARVVRTIFSTSGRWRAFKDEMKRIYGRVREDLLEIL